MKPVPLTVSSFKFDQDEPLITKGFCQEAVLPITMQGHKFYALMDSGADINCVKTEVLEKCGLMDKMEPIHHKHTFHACDQGLLKPRGSVMLTFTSAVGEDKICSYVLDELSNAMILGLPFLYKYEVTRGQK